MAAGARRVAVVLPAPAPYREGLLAALHAREGLSLRVIYLAADQPSWDTAADWYPTRHPYPALRLRGRQRPRPGRTPVTVPRGLGRALAAADADVVVASEYGLDSLRSYAWARTHRRASIILTECIPDTDRLLSAPQLTLHRWLARHVDELIPVSAAGRERLRAFGVAADRIVVSTQPAELAAIRAAVAAPDAVATGDGVAAAGATTDGPLVVLTAGRLVPDKNLGALLEAVAALRSSGPSVALRVAGTGFLADELRERGAALGVDVTWLGGLGPAELAAEYARADVFALVSTYEPFGVVVREATAAGLPIVCSARAGAAGEVALQGRNALLVDPSSTAAIADALRTLVDDPGLRAQMGAESHALDRELDGRNVDAFADAVVRAAVRVGR